MLSYLKFSLITASVWFCGFELFWSTLGWFVKLCTQYGMVLKSTSYVMWLVFLTLFKMCMMLIVLSLCFSKNIFCNKFELYCPCHVQCSVMVYHCHTEQLLSFKKLLYEAFSFQKSTMSGHYCCTVDKPKNNVKVNKFITPAIDIMP